MTRVSSNRKEETRKRIVSVAARAIRSHGYEGVSLVEVMKKAGLTHGGFYAHFDSRDALLVAALDRASRDIAAEAALVTRQRASAEVSEFRCLVEVYLAEPLLGALENGCPIAALAPEMPRQSAVVHEASVASVELLIAAVHEALPEPHRAAASTVTASLIGSLQLARVLGDNPKGRALLAAARDSLIQRYDTPTLTQ